MSTDTLKIELYGDMRIEFCRRTLSASSAKIGGAIAYLMCAPSRQASKSTLKDLLWIDAGEKAAYNLRFNLWSIKRIFRRSTEKLYNHCRQHMQDKS